MARIQIADLPPVQDLPQGETERIFGAGPRRLGVEALSSHELLASSLAASLTSGLLRIEGTAGADTIHIRQSNNQFSVDGISVQSGGVSQASVAASSVSRVEIYSLSGNDQ